MYAASLKYKLLGVQYTNSVTFSKIHSMNNWREAKSIYDFTVKDINGSEIPLSTYKGHVCIIVNVASECGLAKSNYKELVDLHNEYSESKGLKILAFPCNQFAGQEPGDSKAICCFISARNVKFDIFEKCNVNGSDSLSLWKYLKHHQPGTIGDFIKWNFTKFIIDKNGKVVERHGPNVSPKDLVNSLEKYW